MNWEFRAAIRRDVPGMIEDFRAIMADGIAEWLETHKESCEKEDESSFHEFPPGFYHEGPSYRFRFRMYVGKQSLDPDEYDISVIQTFHGGYTPSYDGLTKVPKFDVEKMPVFTTRTRRTGIIHGIK